MLLKIVFMTVKFEYNEEEEEREFICDPVA